jgi:hypothetical protein
VYPEAQCSTSATTSLGEYHSVDPARAVKPLAEPNNAVSDIYVYRRQGRRRFWLYTRERLSGTLPDLRLSNYGLAFSGRIMAVSGSVRSPCCG